MPEGFLRAQTSQYQCPRCKRCLDDSRFVGIGILFIRPRPNSKPKIVMRVTVQCRRCNEVATIQVAANPALWEECQALVLRSNTRDPFGPSSVVHTPATAKDPPTTQVGKAKKPTKRSKSKRQCVVRPSIRPGTPDAPITWDEQRKFLRKVSFRRSTKMFQKWIDQMAPSGSSDPPPPF